MLSLPLFVARIFTNYPDYSFATDDFTVATSFFYTALYFHILLVSVDYSTTVQISGGEDNFYAVSWRDFNEITAHFT